MSLREAMQKIKPAYAIGVSAVLLLVAAVAAYAINRPRSSGLEQVKVLKCTECGEVLRTTMADVRARVTKDPSSPDVPGLPCPKCGKNQQAFATECPRDHTVFFPTTLVTDKEGEPPRRVEAKCPGCGRDPAEEARAELRKRLGK